MDTLSVGGLRSRLRILILHSNLDLARTRRTSFNHTFCLLKYAPWNNYQLHAFGQPIPSELRHQHFDAIILDTTFLCWRWSNPRDEFNKLLRDYAFIADSEAVKIALPQDEYDHTALLDEWMVNWRVDLIYSVCYEHRDIFYPVSREHAEIVEGLTGFVDDADIALMRRLARPFEERAIDVGYRAKSLPAYFGRFGRLKAEIGRQFAQSFHGVGLALDISVDPDDTLLGDDWLRFLGNCRFTIGCESGSSLLDPVGDINHACAAYLAEHPGAEFEEIEAACFPGKDMRRIYSAISPRIFEAALAGACQILTPGRYMGILEPDEHYIPWERDGSNREAVLASLNDRPAARERVENCRAALLENDGLSYRGFVNGLLDRIERRLESRAGPSRRQTAKLEAPASAAERVHRLAEIIVGASLGVREDASEAKATGARAANTAAEDRATSRSGPTICLLALSAIPDDPRVRRQGDLFAGAGWNVVGVGLPGGRSEAPNWPILTEATVPADSSEADRAPDLQPSANPVVASSAPPSARLAAAARRGLARPRVAVHNALAGRPRLRRSALLLWRSLMFCLSWACRVYRSARGVLRRAAGSADRALSGGGGLQELAGFLSGPVGLRRGLKHSWRRLWLGFRPNLAEEIFWQELAISRPLNLIYQAARSVDADIWLANDWTALPLAARLARERGGAYVYDTHEFAIEEYAEKPEWRRWMRPVVRAIEKEHIRRAAVTSAVSAGIAARLDRLYSLPKPTLVVRNTPLYDKTGLRLTGDRIRVLYHGIIVPGRGLESAIESVAQWRPEFDLVIRGPTNPQFTPVLRGRIAKLGLSGRVELAAPVPMTALVREAAAFDIGFFALPGHSGHNEYALPNKIFEYIMAGLCLCVSDLSEIAAIVNQYRCGVTIPGADPAAIAAAINSLDRETIDRCKRNSLVAARELCWERESDRLAAAYAAVGKRASGDRLEPA